MAFLAEASAYAAYQQTLSSRLDKASGCVVSLQMLA